MDSSATPSGRVQIVPKQCDNNIFQGKQNSPTRRTPSFSSLSSSSLSSCSSSLRSLYFPDESPLSPPTPRKFSGVPFSWETLPGIPKKHTHSRKKSLLKQLPLPPTSTPPYSKKSHFEELETRKKFSPENLKKDPFVAALVECSKDDDNGDDDRDSSSRNNFFSRAKVTKSISDRLGLINAYASCKTTSAVSESLVYLPRPTRTPYDLFLHHHRRRRHPR